ncbi:MAG: SCO family protein [Vulcanimicrobiaceae bacterium]
MDDDRAMMRGAVAAALAVFTALLSHAVIGVVANAREGAAFAHVHATVGVATLTLMALGSLAGVPLVRAFSGDTRAFLTAVRGIRSIGFIPLWVVCAIGGSFALAMQESLEQLASFGHLTGLASCFGDLWALGVVIVIACASIVALSAVRCASFLAAAQLRIVSYLLALRRRFTGLAGEARRIDPDRSGLLSRQALRNARRRKRGPPFLVASTPISIRHCNREDRIFMFRAPLRLAALVLAAVFVAACSPATSAKAAPDFTLTDQNGKAFTLSSLRGNATALFFGYSHCPDTCPLTLAKLAQAKRDLGAMAEKTRIVVVTVDPARDRPPVLRHWLAQFDPQFIGVTGTPSQIHAVEDAYGAWSVKLPGKHAGKLPSHDPEYLEGHLASIFMIDPRGYIRSLRDEHDKPDVIAATFRELAP